MNTKLPEDEGLLVPFEIENIPAYYRDYYRIKRNNFFASIQRFQAAWNYYIALDEIWFREFRDLGVVTDTATVFPLMLYLNAHAKMRIAMELAFSGCLSEARSILRDAIEFVAHAHRMVGDTMLQNKWLGKNDGDVALKAFKDAFEHYKRDRLFEGLDELYLTWGEMSETGSHANLNAMCDRFVQVTSPDRADLKLNYCGVEPRTWALSVFSMLLTCFTMEATLYRDYVDRLGLDDQLREMRDAFEMRKERLRQFMIVHWNVQAPSPVIAPQPLLFHT